MRQASIEIINPGGFSLIVDKGRYGYGEAGVPPSSALDLPALTACNALLEQADSACALEILGSGFSFRAGADMTVAVTGAKVALRVNEREHRSWSSFTIKKGDRVLVDNVLEGFRYYLGFSGALDIPRVIGSFSTNLDCGFGGFRGRPLAKGDVLELKDPRLAPEETVPEELIPPMESPHRIRFVEGPEKDLFTEDSWGKFCGEGDHSCYTVSSKFNRTGIRLEGRPLAFRRGVKESITSEGVLPGTVQVPADGMPIILLFERTTGGYARIGVVAEGDWRRLAHLKPRDQVIFERISTEEAHRLRMMEKEKASRLLNRIRRSS